jgi:hypothetical protein
MCIYIRTRACVIRSNGVYITACNEALTQKLVNQYTLVEGEVLVSSSNNPLKLPNGRYVDLRIAATADIEKNTRIGCFIQAVSNFK